MATSSSSAAISDDSSHATYHLKFDEYTPLESEQVMRSYSTAMLPSKPPSSSSKPSQPETPQTPTKTSTTQADTPTRQRPPPTPVSPTRGRFVKLQPPSSEAASPDFAYGIIHLYRDVSGTEDKEITSASRNPGSPTEEDDVLAILAVPSYMTANDFMGFVGEKHKDQVSHFRMIRTEAANRYMVLLKFRTHDAAKEFHKLFNGKTFNSMEPETCHVVFVKSVTFQASSTTQVDSIFPFIDDPFLPPAAVSPTDPTRPAPPPTPSLRELPTCPVCLERMDASVTGLLTILCQHTFHCQCLTKWGDGSCPICRYSQKKDATRESNHCKACGATDDLWICLICGHIGCGRYNGAHAFDHHLSTNHLYALELETQRVWDYAGDGYVHRLIQTKSDGKLVEFPPVASTGTYYHPDDREVDDDISREKLDAMGMEYTYLLTSQLDSQRVYYEEKITAAADKAAKTGKALDQANAQIGALEKRLDEFSLQIQKMNEERQHLLHSLQESIRAKEKTEAKTVKLVDTVRSLQKELKEERLLSEGLMVKVKTLSEENEKFVSERNDLQEQNQDLMFMLENMGREDIKGGDVGIAQTKKKGSQRGRK